MLEASLVQLVAAVLLEGLTEPVDHAQRGAQVVGDRIAEGFELLVCGLGAFLGDPQRMRRSSALGDVLGDPEKVNGSILLVEDRNFLRVQPSRTALRLDGLLRDVDDDALGERFAIARLKGLGLSPRKEIEIVSTDEVHPLDAEKLLAGAIDSFEPQ